MKTVYVDRLFLLNVLADYLLLPVGSGCIYATHGHIYNESHLPPMKRGDLLLHGHTHVSFCREHESYVCCNPGSVSIPKEDTPRGYILLEDRRLTWKTLEGETCRVYDWRPERFR